MKFEYIALYMIDNDVDVYLIQETWLEGDQDHWNINGITFFTHAPEKQSSGRGRGGLAIALSKRAMKAWERAGKKDLLRHGVMDDTTRIMAIDLKVPAGNSFECITIFNVYPPSTHRNSEEVVEDFWTQLEDEIARTPKNSIPIVGGDINARIGNRSSHPHSDEQYFGPCGDQHLNDAGKRVIPMMQRCGLRATTTFFEHKKYWTFKCCLRNEFKTLDHFLTHTRLSNRIIDAKCIVGGPASDHDPIVLKLLFKKKKGTGVPPPRLTKIRVTWEKLDESETAMSFEQIAMEKIRNLTNNGIPSAKAFSKAIVEAAEETCAEDEPTKKGWFATASEILKPLVVARNEASEKMKEDPTQENKETFRVMRLKLNKEVVRAKNRSEFDKATKIMETMRTRPRKAWKKMRSLQAGRNSHHRTVQVVNFSKDGVKATNDKENLQIACNHFEKVYNSESFFDPTVIDDVPQCPENPNFDQLPSLEELNKAIA